MKNVRRETAREAAHRVRSRLTFVLLCSHTLQLDLRERLKPEHHEQFRQMDRALEETRAALRKCLREVERRPSPPLKPSADPTQWVGAAL